MARRRTAATGSGPFTVPATCLSGWCGDGHHGGCPATFVFWAAQGNTEPTSCRCTCHAGDTGDTAQPAPAVKKTPRRRRAS